MKKKLTLSIEKEVIERAKKYAHNNDLSLSDIVENYLKAITRDENVEKIELSPIVESLKGSFNAPQSCNYKKF